GESLAAHEAFGERLEHGIGRVAHDPRSTPSDEGRDVFAGCVHGGRDDNPGTAIDGQLHRLLAALAPHYLVRDRRVAITDGAAFAHWAPLRRATSTISC